MPGSAASYILGQQSGHIRVRTPGHDFFLLLHGLIVAALTGPLDDRTFPVVLSLSFGASFVLLDEVCRLTDGPLHVSIPIGHLSLHSYFGATATTRCTSGRKR